MISWNRAEQGADVSRWSIGTDRKFRWFTVDMVVFAAVNVVLIALFMDEVEKDSVTGMYFDAGVFIVYSDLCRV